LFRASVNPDTLARYQDGSISSMVIGNGSIKYHRGFEPEGISPQAGLAVAMQAMAAMSGQYYMHQLSQQLREINRKLDELRSEIKIQNLRDKTAVLMMVRDQFTALAGRENHNREDLTTVQRLKEQVTIVYYSYLPALDYLDPRKLAQSNSGSESGKLWQICINLGLDPNTSDRFEVNQTIEMCYLSSLLIEWCRVAEIGLRLELNDLADVPELLGALNREHRKSFHRNVGKEIERMYRFILDEAKRVKSLPDPYILFFPDEVERRYRMNNYDSIIESYRRVKDAVRNNADIVAELNAKVEASAVITNSDAPQVLYLKDGQSSRMFLPDA